MKTFQKLIKTISDFFVIFRNKNVTSISNNDKKQGGPNGPLPVVKGLSNREVTKDEKKRMRINC